MSPEHFVLHGFLHIHHAMIRDGYRLAGACAAATTDDELGALGRWYERFHGNLEDHHRAEDDIYFPRLRELDAALAAKLDGLGEDHHEVDAALAAVAQAFANRDRAAAATSTAHLAELLDEHIKAEERLVVPATMRLMSTDEQRALEQGLQKAAGISQIAFVLPWLIDGVRPHERGDLLKQLPLPLRLMHAMFWRRRYARLSRPLAAGNATAAPHLGGIIGRPTGASASP